MQYYVLRTRAHPFFFPFPTHNTNIHARQRQHAVMMKQTRARVREKPVFSRAARSLIRSLTHAHSSTALCSKNSAFVRAKARLVFRL